MAFRDLPEHERARQWREACGLTRGQLADLTGFSVRAIALLESGKNNNGGDIDPATMNRYRLICAAIMAGLDFDWRRVRCGDITIRADEWR